MKTMEERNTYQIMKLGLGPAGDGKDRVNLNLEVRHADFSQN